MSLLTYTVPDAPLIDALRGVCTVVGCALFIAAPAIWWHARRILPTRIRGLVLVLLASDVYVSATEAEQIGHPMLVWRLPLGLLVIVGALIYMVRLAVAVGSNQPVK